MLASESAEVRKNEKGESKSRSEVKTSSQYQQLGTGVNTAFLCLGPGERVYRKRVAESLRAGPSHRTVVDCAR